jgi:D-alanyl-D-alanine carboxypeptidase/D-alanyl-D-alanine-endopeptidase (penicillin-binding protein 4)
MNRFFCSIILSLIAFSASAQSLFTPFEEKCPEASFSFCLKDVRTGVVEEQYAAKKALAPASVLKLLSSIAAFDKYGDDYQFRTKVGYTGSIKKGILKGSLLIKASGDPTWNSKYFPDNDVFSKIVKMIKAKGIHKIEWGLIIDEGDIDYSFPRTWIWEDIANYFGSPVHAINLYDNTYKLNFSSSKAGSLTHINSVMPLQNNLNFTNEVYASKENRDNAWIFGGPNSSERIIKGSIPENRSSFIVKGSISKTNELFAEQLRLALKKSNIVCNKVLLVKKITAYTSLGDLRWPSLSKIIHITNQKSVNLFAEALSKKIGNIEKYWKSKSLNVNGIKFYDGSGVSRFNALSCEFLCDLLIYADKQNYRQSLINSLPKAGQTGTLKYFGKATCLEGNLIAKTGSMKAVRSYAGYITVGGQRKAFSCIVNNYSCTNKEIKKLVEKLLISLCK